MAGPKLQETYKKLMNDDDVLDAWDALSDAMNKKEGTISERQANVATARNGFMHLLLEKEIGTTEAEQILKIATNEINANKAGQVHEHGKKGGAQSR